MIPGSITYFEKTETVMVQGQTGVEKGARANGRIRPQMAYLPYCRSLPKIPGGLGEL